MKNIIIETILIKLNKLIKSNIDSLFEIASFTALPLRISLLYKQLCLTTYIELRKC